MATHIKVDTFTSSGTWTCPAGVTSIDVEAIGAGGGGTINVGGGGGGAYSASTAISVTPGNNYTITVGTSAVNTNGGDSSFSTTVIAKGGLSGTNGGTGGTAAASTGTTKFSGGNGTLGTAARAGGGSGSVNGAGSGSTPGSPTGGQGGSTTAGSAGKSWGGGGASQTATATAGYKGYVQIRYSITTSDGFPAVKSRARARYAASTSHAITMPGSISAGNLLILIYGTTDNPTITTPSGWTALASTQDTLPDVKSAVFYKVAAGGDTATIALTTSEPGASYVYCIDDWSGTPEATAANSTAAAVNSPSHTPSTGAADYLWISAGIVDWIVTIASIDTPPTSFDNYDFVTGAVGGVSLVTSERRLNASTLDPAAYTTVADAMNAFTITVPAKVSEYQYLQTASDTADLTTYTFASQNLGTAFANRQIIVGITGRKAGATTSISSVTIAGISATIVVQQSNTGTNTDVAGIAIANVPTGTTGDIVVTFGAGMVRSAIHVYRARGILEPAFDTGASTALDPTTTLDIPDTGFAIGVGITAASTTAGWTGLTEDNETVVETFVTTTSASQEFSSPETGRTLTIDFGAPSESSGVFASWQYGQLTEIAITKSSRYTIELPAMSTLSDNFDDNSFDTAKWTSYLNGGTGSVTEQNKRLEIVSPATGSQSTGIYADGSFRLYDSSVIIELLPYTPVTDHFFWFGVYTGGGPEGYVAIGINESGNINAENHFATLGTPVAYDPLLHRFFRIREASGATYLEFSGNGTSWTTFASDNSLEYDWTICWPEVYIFAQGTQSSTATAFIDNIGVPVTENIISKSIAYTIEAPWYDSAWSYRVPITIPADKVNADLTDFPVYVDLSTLPAGFHTNVKANGADIRMTLANGTSEIPVEVVFYDTATDTGELHFKGTIDGDVDTLFWLYYGNAAASIPARNSTYGSENVWTNNYKAVYHMQQDPSGNGTDAVLDSTSALNHLTPSGAPVLGTGKLAGRSIVFDGVNDQLKDTDQVWPDATNTTTIQFWSNFASADGAQNATIYRYGDSGASRHSSHAPWANDIYFDFGAVSGAGRVSGSYTPYDDKYSFVHLTSNGSTSKRIYIDGAVVYSNDVTADAPAGDKTGLAIGSGVDTEYHKGTIDEWRASTVERTSTWISTEHNNQNDPATFSVAGAQETAPITTTSITKSSQYAIVTEGRITTESSGTIGRTTAGGSEYGLVGETINNPAGRKVIFSTPVDIVRVSAHVRKTFADKVTRVRIYSDSAGARGTLLYTSTNTTITLSSYSWLDYTFSSAVSLSAGTYWFQLEGDEQGPSTGNGFLAYDTTGGDSYWVSDVGVPNYVAYDYSIHVDYDSSVNGLYLQYAVTPSPSITKNLTYKIVAPASEITKSSQYSISDENSLTKSIQYSIVLAKTHTVNDNFDDNSIDTTTKWFNWGDTEIVETNNRLEIDVLSGGANYQGIESKYFKDFTGSSVSIELINAGNQALGSLEVLFGITDSSTDNKLFFLVTGGNLVAYRKVGGSNGYITQATYNSTTHKYLRLRESAGTSYWEYSANGTSWTALHSETNPITLTSMKTELVAGVYSTEATPTEIIFDSYNIVQPLITKSIQYEISSADTFSITKAIAYTVISSDSITKNVTYKVQPDESITKALSYLVRTDTSSSKSTRYAIIDEIAPSTKQVIYRVRTDSSIPKTSSYEVVTGSALSKAVTYTVQSPSSLTKSNKYTAISPVSLTKDITYSTQPSAGITKGLIYKVADEVSLTKSIAYEMQGASTISKSSKYTVISPVDLSKSIDYEVQTDSSVTKSLTYRVVTDSSIQKSLAYTTGLEGSITKSSRYAIVSPVSIEKDVMYTSITSSDISKGIDYEVVTDSSITKANTYRVVTPTSIEESLTYVIAGDLSQTKSSKYTVLTDSSLTKSISYEIVGRIYSKTSGTLPTNEENLPTLYSSQEYIDASSDNDIYAEREGLGYLVHQFKLYATDQQSFIRFTWQGQATVAPSTSPVVMQLYNYDTAQWDTFATNNSSPANTDFTLVGLVNTANSTYHSPDREVTGRIYQSI